MTSDPSEPDGSTQRQNPFPGLRPFEANDTHLFFGREGQSEDILRSLRRSRLLAVVGASGSGKSSLVRAGLLPHLHGGFFEQAGSHWRVALLRPGGDPIEALAHALVEQSVLATKPDEAEEIQRHTQLMAAQLRRSGLGLVEAVRLARPAPAENVLVVIDQFEELFRFGHTAGAAYAGDDAAAFVKLILEATRQDKLPIYACLTMRSDFIGECARFRGLPEAVAAGLYLIPRMTRAQRRAAIEQPVRVGGGHITPRLVTRILNDVGDDPDQLPIMQHALMRAWDHWQAGGEPARPIDLPDYEAIGGTASALSMHADEAYGGLGERDQTIARKMFQRLTEKDADNREARRPTLLSVLAEVAEVPVDNMVKIVDVFRAPGRSFLMPPTLLLPDTTIDISHESLIRGWKRLREWVEQEAESARVYKRLADTAALHSSGNAGLWRDPDLAVAIAWRERERPNEAWSRRYHGGWPEAMAFLEESGRAREAEARAARLRQRLTAAAALVFLVLAGAAVWEAIKAERSADEAIAQRDRAEQQTILADTQSRRAEGAAQQALASAAEATQQRDRAEEQTRIAKRNEAEAKHQQEIANKSFKYVISNILHFNAQRALMAYQYKVAGLYDEILHDLEDWEGTIRDYTRNDPNNSYWLQQIAYVKSQMASVLVAKADHQAALALYLQSRELLLGIVVREPANAQYRIDLLNIHAQITSALINLNRRPDALDELLTARKTETELPADGSRNPKLRFELAAIDLSLGDELLAAKRDDEAQAAFAEAQALLTELAAQDPTKPAWMQKLATSDNRVGDALWRKKQFNEAMAMYAGALKAFRAAASLDANEADYVSGAVDTDFKIGATWTELGKWDEALIAYGDALAMLADASKKWPDKPYWSRAYVSAQEKIGDLLARQSKPTEALDVYQRARERQKTLLAAAPADQSLRFTLVRIDDRAGDLLVRLGEIDKALEVRNEVLAASQALLAATPDSTDRKDDLALSYNLVADVLLRQKHYDEAIANYREALKVLRALLEATPDNKRWQSAELSSLQAIGDALAAKGSDDEALALYREGLEAGAKLMALDVADTDSLRRVAMVDTKIGGVLAMQRDMDGAAKAYRAALDLQESFVGRHPDNIAGRITLAQTYGMLGEVLRVQGKLLESSGAFEKNLAVGRAARDADAANARSWQWLTAAARDLGGLSYALELAGMFEQALKDADLALSIAPGETFIAGKRAHALMFLGRVDEARSIYLGHRGEQANGQPWEKLTLDDFAALRNVGLSHPLMEEIQMTFATKL